MTIEFVARLSQLQPGVGFEARVAGRDIAIWRLGDGTLRALDNTCLHVGGPLAQGAVEDGCVVCPWHGWTYRLDTGSRRTALGDLPGVGVYQVWARDDEVWIEVPAAP